jgi:hypothetical protein
MSSQESLMTLQDFAVFLGNPLYEMQLFPLRGY